MNKLKNLDAKKIVSQNSIWIVLIILVAIMTFADRNFLTLRNITNLLTTEAVTGMLAVGVMFCILSKGIDLSTSGVLALSAVVSASLVQELTATNKVFEGMAPVHPLIAVAAGLGVGLIFGLINGSLIAYTKIPPFIATLGTMLITRATALLYNNSFPVPTLTTEFRRIGQGGWLFGIPNVVTALVLLLVIGGFLLKNTRYGKNVYAIGGNDVAARVAGINVEFTIVKIYVFSSLCSALAGVMLAARVGSASPTLGVSYELYAIAAATVGGVSHSGGIGRMTGVLSGILVLGVVNNGMLLLGISTYMQDIVRGLIIICAVVFDMRKNAKRA